MTDLFPDSVIRAVEAKARESMARSRRLPYELRIKAEDGLAPLLARAAKARGCSIPTYARRAIAAFVAHDLQMPFSEVTNHFPAAVDFGMANTAQIRQRNAKGQQMPRQGGDNGDGYGDWRVHP